MSEVYYFQTVNGSALNVSRNMIGILMQVKILSCIIRVAYPNFKPVDRPTTDTNNVLSRLDEAGKIFTVL